MAPPSSPHAHTHTHTPKVVNLAHNALVQLPECLATALPAITTLLLQDNLLTELPPLPPSLGELDVSTNRLKRLDAAQLARLTALTKLSASGAFSHRPHGEGGPVVGALARLARLRGYALALSLDAEVYDMVRTRRRFD
jgi:hypothetical protein